VALTEVKVIVALGKIGMDRSVAALTKAACLGASLPLHMA
jgi:hypothetical protein